jgi:hypothetical protein
MAIQTLRQVPSDHTPYDSQLMLDKIKETLKETDAELADRVKQVVGIETINGKQVCKLKVDLSYLESLKKPFQQSSKTENPNNQKVAEIFFKILECESVLPGYGIDELRIVDLNIQGTNVSGRCVFYRDQKELSRFVTQALTKFNLSYTLVTHTFLSSLQNFPALKELSIDGCLNLSQLPKSSHHEGVLSATLEKVSLVKTSITTDLQFLKNLEKAFPSIQIIHISQHFGTKFLGVKDEIKRKTAIDPIALNPCGHVISRESLAEIRELNACKACWLNLDLITPFYDAQFPVSSMEKINGKWVVDILDYAREKLSSRIAYFHPVCQHLFTESTIKNKFGVDPEVMNKNPSVLKHMNCPGCQELNRLNPLDLKRLFLSLTPHNPIEVSENCTTLNALDDYTKRGTLFENKN